MSTACGGLRATAVRYIQNRLWLSGKTMLEQIPSRISWNFMERKVYIGAGLLSGLVTSRGTHTSLSRRTIPHGRDPQRNSGWKMQLMGRSHTEEVCGLSPVGRTPCWNRWSGWGGISKRNNVGWTDCNFYSLSCCSTVWEEVEKSGVKKLSPWRKEECGKIFEDLILFLIIVVWFD